MKLQEAARKAEREDALHFRHPRTGSLEHNYVVYDLSSHEVVAQGEYEVCVAAMPPPGQSTPAGKWYRIQALADVVAELDEAAGELACLPDSREAAEWD